jgi:photosystem II stability/assembly factor-like uncharacterized protein
MAAAALALAALEARAGWVKNMSGLNQDTGIIDIASPTPETAYAVGVHDPGTGNQSAQVWYTHTSGASWMTAKPSPNPIAFYVDVFAPTAERAYVAATRYVYITTDGGASWLPSGDAGLLTLITAVGGHGADLVVAAVSDGRIFRSDTGGASWTEVANPSSAQAFTRVVFVDAMHGWILAGSQDTDTGIYSDGAMLRTRDGGLSWDVLFEGESRSIWEASFISDSEGWMVTNSGGISTLERTTDGGDTWTPMTLPAYSFGAIDAVTDVAFFDRCEGWLAANTDDPGQLTSALFYTTDGGESWTETDMAWTRIDSPLPIPLRGNPLTFEFSSRESGYTGGYFEILGTYTADAGAPDCTAPGPDDPGFDGESGCGCSIVW